MCDLKVFGEEFEFVLNYLHHGHHACLADQFFSRIRKATKKFVTKINHDQPLLSLNDLLEACKSVKDIKAEVIHAVFNWESKLQLDEHGETNFCPLDQIRQYAGFRIVCSADAKKSGLFARVNATHAYTRLSHSFFKKSVPPGPPSLLAQMKFSEAKITSFKKALDRYERLYGAGKCAFLRRLIETGCYTTDPELLQPPFPHPDRFSAQVPTESSVDFVPLLENCVASPSFIVGESELMRVTKVFLGEFDGRETPLYHCVWKDGTETNEPWANLYDAETGLTEAARAFFEKNPKYERFWTLEEGLPISFCMF